MKGSVQGRRFRVIAWYPASSAVSKKGVPRVSEVGQMLTHYRLVDKIGEDPDLLSLHGDPRFEAIVEEIRKRRQGDE